MAGLDVPAHLRAAAASAPALRAWVADLPRVVGELARRWRLSLGPPYQPGRQCSWVAPARTAAGADVVLKVGWRHPEGAGEAEGLRYWNGDGVVALHAAEKFGETSALLLEQCVPGTSLGVSLPEPEQDAVLARLLPRLWTAPPPGHPFPSLVRMCDAWAVEFEENLDRSPSAIDAGLARAGIGLFRELPRTAGPGVLLGTDLHAGNVLAARREPWLVIDPKPHVGDPAYDALQHMLNCPARLVADPDGLVRRMAGLLDLDAARLRLWLFARSVQECLDAPALRRVAAALAP